MSSLAYSVDYRHSNGNMHVGVNCEFNQNTAEGLRLEGYAAGNKGEIADWAEKLAQNV